MMHVVHSRFNALLSACVLSLIATAGWSQSLTWLGTLPGYDTSYAYGVSNNGVVVGSVRDAAGYGRAFRWQNGVMQDLGTLPNGGYSEAYGVSADGAVVVGMSGRRAFRWTASSGRMDDLGHLGGGSYTDARAYAVSANGAVVVGWSHDYYGNHRAFRWQNNVMREIGRGNSYRNSYAYDVSANGAVVVGMTSDDYYHYRYRQHAFRWQNGVWQYLGTLGGSYGEAYGVSADGSVVVGWAHDGAGYERAFRWENGVMQNLGTLPGYTHSNARDVSADGSVVVGAAHDGAGLHRAFRWTASGGMEDLNTTYASLLTDGSELYEARAISPNGRYIVGWGYNAATSRYEAFLLDTQGTPPCTLDGDVNGDGRVDDADLLRVLFNFGNQCP
jgi:probable HAF family extracellular repeat protein